MNHRTSQSASAIVGHQKAENASTEPQSPDLFTALLVARCHLITLGGDPRTTIAEHGDPYGDQIQAAVLDEIDAALSIQQNRWSITEQVSQQTQVGIVPIGSSQSTGNDRF